MDESHSRPMSGALWDSKYVDPFPLLGSSSRWCSPPSGLRSEGAHAGDSQHIIYAPGTCPVGIAVSPPDAAGPSRRDRVRHAPRARLQVQPFLSAISPLEAIEPVVTAGNHGPKPFPVCKRTMEIDRPPRRGAKRSPKRFVPRPPSRVRASGSGETPGCAPLIRTVAGTAQRMESRSRADGRRWRRSLQG